MTAHGMAWPNTSRFHTPIITKVSINRTGSSIAEAQPRRSRWRARPRRRAVPSSVLASNSVALGIVMSSPNAGTSAGIDSPAKPGCHS